MRSEPKRTPTERSESDAGSTRPVSHPTPTGPPSGASDPSEPDPDLPMTGRRVTAQEAADALNITVEAVRSRIKRGTLRKEKAADGTVYVWLNNDLLEGETRQHTDRTRGETTNRAQPDATLVEALWGQIEMLRAELEDRKEEARRKDSIIMSLSQRVPGLPPPAPEAPQNQHETSTEGAAGDVPPEQQEPGKRRSWLVRFFFGP